MLGTLPPEAAASKAERMRALRVFLYEPGWWNDERPFSYDLSDPTGKAFAARLLPTYLASRKGNCVSMPMLFVILGERLGLDLTLSTAPLHVFVKWTDPAAGQTWNFEATSGGFARDSHYREKLPMSDEAIANGVYMKTLTRREALSVIATLVLEHLLDTGRYDKAIAVADVLLEAYPANAYVLVKKGAAYARLLNGLKAQFPGAVNVPEDVLARAKWLHHANLEAFEKAEELGWREAAAN